MIEGLTLDVAGREASVMSAEAASTRGNGGFESSGCIVDNSNGFGGGSGLGPRIGFLPSFTDWLDTPLVTSNISR